MFPLPIRMMVKVKPASPIIQRLMSWGMSWMMDNQDGKVQAGQALKEINKVDLVIVFSFRCVLPLWHSLQLLTDRLFVSANPLENLKPCVASPP